MITAISAAAFFLASCGHNIDPESGLLILKSETKWLCSVDSKEKISKISYTEYNREGAVVKYIEYSPNGLKAVESHFEYENDEKIEEKYLFDAAGQTVDSSLIVYAFDDMGRASTLVEYDSFGSVERIVKLDYDENGNLVKRTVEDSLGVVSKELAYEYAYNSGGKVVEVIVTNAKDEVVSRDVLSYENGGSAISVINYNSLGEVETIRSYEFNHAGRISLETESAPNGEILKQYIIEYAYF